MIFIIGPINCGISILSLKLSKHFNSGYISALKGIFSTFGNVQLIEHLIDYLKKDHLFVIKDVLHQLNEIRHSHNSIEFENSIIDSIINPLDFCRLVNPEKDIIVFIYSQFLIEFEESGLKAIESILRFWMDTKLIDNNRIIIYDFEKNQGSWDYLYDKIINMERFI